MKLGIDDSADALVASALWWRGSEVTPLPTRLRGSGRRALGTEVIVLEPGAILAKYGCTTPLATLVTASTFPLAGSPVPSSSGFRVWLGIHCGTSARVRRHPGATLHGVRAAPAGPKAYELLRCSQRGAVACSSA